MIAERDGAIAGILPLVHQKSRLFGNALIAAPFLVEGGPLTAESGAQLALDDAALELKRQTGAAYVEFRSRVARRAELDGAQGSVRDLQAAAQRQ